MVKQALCSKARVVVRRRRRRLARRCWKQRVSSSFINLVNLINLINLI